MTQPRPYQVDNATLRSRWTDYIRPLVFAGAVPSPAPTALFIGAQPGAGKTQTAARVAAQYGRPFVSIDSDELRKFHPQFRDIMRTDPLRMAVLTNQAAAEWVQMAIAEARTAGYDMLIENSFHTPQVVLTEAARFKDAGYTTHAVALAVPGRDSRLGAVRRYVDAATAGRTARWTNLASHEAGMAGLPATVEALQSSPAIDRLTITDRAGDTHYDSRTQPGDARAVLTRVCDTLPTPEHRQRWLDLWTDTSDRLQSIPNLDQDQLRPLLDRLALDAQQLTPAASPTAAKEPLEQRLDRITSSLAKTDETAGPSAGRTLEVDDLLGQYNNDAHHQRNQRGPRL